MKYYGTYNDPRDLIPRQFLTNVVCNDYDATQTYLKNDTVIYRKQIYKANTDIATPEEWTASHWTAINNISDGMYFKNASTDFLDFTDHTAFPQIEDVEDYVKDHKEDIVSMYTAYTLVQRIMAEYGRAVEGDTLCMSKTMGDKINEAGDLQPALDVTYDAATDTMIIP